MSVLLLLAGSIDFPIKKKDNDHQDVNIINPRHRHVLAPPVAPGRLRPRRSLVFFGVFLVESGASFRLSEGNCRGSQCRMPRKRHRAQIGNQKRHLRREGIM